MRHGEERVGKLARLARMIEKSDHSSGGDNDGHAPRRHWAATAPPRLHRHVPKHSMAVCCIVAPVPVEAGALG
jgi:hypothetical protein